MRRIQLIYLFIATFAIAPGCSNDEPSTSATQQEILLEGETLQSIQSRSSQPLSSEYTMMVQSIYHSKDGNINNYFFPQAMEFIAGTNGVWAHDGSPLYYPSTGTLDFLAYAVVAAAHKPSTSYAPASLTSASYTFSSMTLDFGTKLDGTDAVLYSDLLPEIASGAVNGPQSMHFRHAMAKIVFQGSTDDNATEQRFVINQITVKGVKLSGTLTVTPRANTIVGEQEIGSSAEWTSLSSPTNVSLLTTSQQVTKVGANLGSPLYLPRQGSSAADVEIELSYSYQPSSGPTFGPEKISLVLSDCNWQPGYQYTYSITCNLTEIKVECQSSGAIVDTAPEDINLDELYHGDTIVKTS